MSNSVPETCPRCKGWVYHRRVPCDCPPPPDLVLIQWSPRRWVVVRIRERGNAGGRTVFLGDVVYGPNSKADCEDCIRRTNLGGTDDLFD